jgi:hypothetical protein
MSSSIFSTLTRMEPESATVWGVSALAGAESLMVGWDGWAAAATAAAGVVAAIALLDAVAWSLAPGGGAADPAAAVAAVDADAGTSAEAELDGEGAAGEAD